MCILFIKNQSIHRHKTLLKFSFTNIRKFFPLLTQLNKETIIFVHNADLTLAFRIKHAKNVKKLADIWSDRFMTTTQLEGLIRYVSNIFDMAALKGQPRFINKIIERAETSVTIDSDPSKLSSKVSILQ